MSGYTRCYDFTPHWVPLALDGYGNESRRRDTTIDTVLKENGRDSSGITDNLAAALKEGKA